MSSSYDIILMDWKMPGMDGVETARRIRAGTEGKSPILVLTSYDWPEMCSSRSTVKVEPFPFSLSTVMAPPIKSKHPPPDEGQGPHL